jgi:hypothetical protein
MILGSHYRTALVMAKIWVISYFVPCCSGGAGGPRWRVSGSHSPTPGPPWLCLAVQPRVRRVAELVTGGCDYDDQKVCYPSGGAYRARPI